MRKVLTNLALDLVILVSLSVLLVVGVFALLFWEVQAACAREARPRRRR